MSASSPEQWGDLTNNDHKPLINKAISGAYPPGSTFKTVVALAALDAGVITPRDDVPLHRRRTGSAPIDFHCWKKGGHGAMNLRLGLKNSCDCFFYQVALKLGIDAIEAGARKLGLGAADRNRNSRRARGFIPDRDWKQATFKEPWQQGETLVAGIGQGYVLATPLQLCTLAARIASGMQVTPRIVHSLGAQRVAAHNAGADRLFREGARRGARRHERGDQRAGRHGYWWRITGQELRDGRQDRHRAGARHYARRNAPRGVRKNEVAALGAARPRACSSPTRRSTSRATPAPSSSSMARLRAHPHVQIARDALLFAQQRDILGRATAYPVKSADASL